MHIEWFISHLVHGGICLDIIRNNICASVFTTLCSFHACACMHNAGHGAWAEVKVRRVVQLKATHILAAILLIRWTGKLKPKLQRDTVTFSTHMHRQRQWHVRTHTHTREEAEEESEQVCANVSASCAAAAAAPAAAT